MSEEPEQAEAQMTESIKRRDTEVAGLLQRKDKARAMVVSLQSPPTASKNPELKDTNAAIVEKVVNSLLETEIASVIEALDMEGCDTLMKYVYRFMSGTPCANNALLLKLHAALFEKAGQGAIVRSMTDRKQV